MTESTEKPGALVRILLVDDQRFVAEAVRRMLASAEDVLLEWCGQGAAAVERATAFSPTVILQDLVMPDADGLDVVTALRANPATHDVPIIVLSSREEPAVKAEAFARGANDYLVKLPDAIEVLARIRYHSAGCIAARQLAATHAALKASQAALAAELAEAEAYVRALLPEPLIGTVESAWQFVSSSRLGGDAFGSQWIDEDHLVVYLLDVCGHGVGAALLSVSAMNTLNAHTLPNVDFKRPAEVVAALNQIFTMERHHGLYFTIWYGVYDRLERMLVYASAGHPPAILLEAGRDPQFLRTNAPPIGTMDEVIFGEARTSVRPGAKVYLFSDGVYEVVAVADSGGSGETLSLDDFAALLERCCAGDAEVLPGTAPTPGAARVAAVLDAVRVVQGRPDFDDDCSLVEFRFT